MPKYPLKVICKNNKNNMSYQALVCDLGYTKIFLSFDRATISEITDISIRELGELKVDTVLDVGQVEIYKK